MQSMIVVFSCHIHLLSPSGKNKTWSPLHVIVTAKQYINIFLKNNYVFIYVVSLFLNVSVKWFIISTSLLYAVKS